MNAKHSGLLSSASWLVVGVGLIFIGLAASELQFNLGSTVDYFAGDTIRETADKIRAIGDVITTAGAIVSLLSSVTSICFSVAVWREYKSS